MTSVEGTRARPAPPPGEAPGGAPGDGRVGYAAALGAAAVALAALALVFLFPYVTRDFRYPLGWDATSAVRVARAVQFDGLARIGTIRAGTPLLFVALSAATRQNLFTLVAVVPALLAGVAGLGAAALARAAFGIRPGWVPVVGVLAWVAFAGNGMMNLHLDNVVNSAVTLSAFAAVLAYAWRGRGLVAATLLFMAAALSHWPFFVLAMAVYAGGAGAVCGLAFVRGDRSEAMRLGRALAWPIIASTAFLGLTFLARPSNGSLGAKFGSVANSLRDRFFGRLHDPRFYYAQPFAAVGAVVAARASIPPEHSTARRLFVGFMLAWVAVTAAGSTAQWAHLPTAGGRLLLYAFPLTVLTGVLVWWLGNRAARRLRGTAGKLAAVGVALAFVGGFGALTAQWRSAQRPWVDAALVAQVEWARAYLDQLPASQPVTFVLGASTAGKPAIQIVRGVLGSVQADHTSKFHGTPSEYLAQPSPAGADRPVAFVLERLGPAGFKAARQASPEREIAPGVLLLEGDLPAAPLDVPPAEQANTGARSIASLCAAVVALLYVVGGGWALALLPRDRILVAALAPALGVAVIPLAALVWDRIDLPVSGSSSLVPMILAALGGWVVAAARTLRERRAG